MGKVVRLNHSKHPTFASDQGCQDLNSKKCEKTVEPRREIRKNHTLTIIAKAAVHIILDPETTRAAFERHRLKGMFRWAFVTYPPINGREIATD